MTVQDMHQSFDFAMDKMGALNYPNMLPEEKDLLINQAQDRITKQRYGLNNIPRKGFEETQKRIEDIKELIRTKVVTPQSAKSDNVSNDVYNIQLENDHWFMIWEKAIINVPGCNSTIRIPLVSYAGVAQEIPPGQGGGQGDTITSYGVTGLEAEVRPVTHLEFEKTRKDAFKGPDKTKVLRLMYRDRAEIAVGTGHTLVTYIYRYIKQPQRVSITTPTNCELSEHMHQEIVDTAVQIALEGIEARRQQTFDKIINTNE